MSFSESPLQNLKVIELASVLAGPSVGMFLAELGAEVIKVENLNAGGDVTRSWKSAGEIGKKNLSAYFCAANWGKQSIAIDLKNPNGQSLVHRLASQADVILVSYKPGDAEKLSMDFNTLSSLNPKLIYAELTAYGKQNSRTGFDAILQAESGFTYLNGSPESGPVKMPVALIDLMAAHQMKEAILLALLQRSQTGLGKHIEVSLLGSALASLANQATNWLVAGMIPQRMGSDHPNIVPYGTIFTTADDSLIVLAVGNDRQFRSLCKVLKMEDLAGLAEFATNEARVQYKERLLPLLHKAIADLPLNELLAQLHAAQVPCGAVHDMEQVFEQKEAQKMILKGPNSLKGVSSLAFGNSDQTVLPPPEFNAHSQQILKSWLQCSDMEITNMANEQIIKT